MFASANIPGPDYSREWLVRVVGVDSSQLDSVVGIISKKIILELKESTVRGKRTHSRNSMFRAPMQQREIPALKERASRRQWRY